MTMFFGLPAQLYFASDATNEEMSKGNNLKKQIIDEPSLHQILTTQNLNNEEKATFIKSNLENPELARENLFKSQRLALAKGFESIKPFRNYHLITSKHHIISNNLRASSKNTYNTVSIQYGDCDFDSKAGRLYQKGNDVFTLKIDAALPDDEVQELFAVYQNCQTELLARNYSISTLMQSLKEVYRGSITITGNPDIKPYDVVYLFDDYSDLSGPVEVEQVIHKFSQDTGFITEITPDLYVTANEWVNMTATDMMSIIMEGTASKLTNSTPTLTETAANNAIPVGGAIAVGAVGTAVVASGSGVAAGAVAAGLMLNPLTAIIAGGLIVGGYFLSQKLADFSDAGTPVIMHPLIHKGKPLIAGLPLHKLDNVWSLDKGQWFKEGWDGLRLLKEDYGDKLTFAASRGNIGNLFNNTIAPKF